MEMNHSALAICGIELGLEIMSIVSGAREAEEGGGAGGGPAWGAEEGWLLGGLNCQ